MRHNQKKTLINFISIYLISATIFTIVLSTLYYYRELHIQKERYQDNLSNYAIIIEFELTKAKDHINLFRDNFIKSKNYNFALFNKNNQIIYSSLEESNITSSNSEKNYIHVTKELDSPIKSIHYIITERYLHKDRKDTFILITTVIFFSLIFIGYIGYILSQILLKREQTRIKQIDNFIKDSAHEINTPITSLIMSVAILKRKGTQDKKILDHILVSSKQISTIYNSLSYIAFENINKIEKSSTFDFANIIKQSINFYSVIANAKRIKIHSNIEPTIINMDKESAKRICNNLLSNAIKYNYQDKNIFITLKNDTLSIQDEGVGLEKKESKKIFKRYYRNSTTTGGFGIGLDIVNSICKKYNIKIDIKSQKGEGTIFILDLGRISTST